MTYDWDNKLLDLSPSKFVQFTRDIIADIPQFANVKIIDGSGDRGRDIEAECFLPDPAGVTKKHQHWIFQCKRYEKMLGESDLSSSINWAEVHKPDVLVFASNARLSPAAVDYLKGQREAKKFEIVDWTADYYKTLIFKHQSILRHYFPDMEIPPQYSQQLVEESNASLPAMFKGKVSREVTLDLKTVDSETIRQELQNVPDDSVRSLIYKTAGDGFLMAGRYKEALKTYNYCLGVIPDYTAVLLNKAYVLEKLHKPNDAESCYEEVTNKDPNNKFALNGIGHLLFMGGKKKAALYRFDKVIKSDPKFIVARDNKATVLWSLERHKEAFECLNETLRDEPNSLSTMAKKADFLSEIQRYEDAISVLDAALAINPSSIILLNSKGHALERMSRLAVPEPQKRMEEALVLFKKTVELNPNFAVGLVNEAICLEAKGDFEAAARLLDMAVAKDPENAHLWISKSNHALNRGNDTDALTYAQKSIKLAKGKQRAHAYLAQARYFAKIKNYKNTLRDVNEAVKLDPSDPFIWFSALGIMQSFGEKAKIGEYEKKLAAAQAHCDKIFDEIKELV